MGICAHWFPELPGNGSSILKISLDSSLTLASAAALLLLKPLLTAAFLRAGAMGGLLTPALATGAAMGAVVALSINSLTALHINVASVSLACAAGVLAITQGTPFWAAIFVWELAQPPLWLLIVFAASATGAHGLHRLIVRTRTVQKTTV
jgi:H+/Cl- antiporter ClcA